jgi:HPt (histidine-containing phosphotransfer) domain-containing protein
MDAYLTKPIDTEALWLELDSLAQRGDAASAQFAPNMPTMPITTATPSSPATAVRDEAPAAVADFTRARQTMDDDLALFDELAQMCLRDLPVQLELARHGLTQADPPAMREAAHAIKGMVSMFGADRTERAAVTVEQQAADLPQATRALAALDQAAGEFMSMLHAHRW